MSAGALLTQLAAVVVAIAVAPLFLGWVNICRAWLQNRSAPPLMLPYRNIAKLLHKEAVIAHDASPLFRFTPYLVFATMATAAAIIPTLGTALAFSRAADAIALVGLFATARVFSALAAMDTGTAFGTLGARREMMIGFLAEPALLMVFFNASLIAGSTELAAIAEAHQHHSLSVHPSLAFAALAFVMVLLAENARIPIDNPATHLELTMIHEAMVLEYSARHLALIEWANALKLFNYACMGFALFLPWGLIAAIDSPALALRTLALLGTKLVLAGIALALVEAINAKIRIFRAPEFLALAFMLAVLGLLVRLLVQG